MNADNELAWVFEILKRAMLARRCGLKEEAISLCNIANNRYKVLLKHPSMEIKMKVIYSNTSQTIDNVRAIVENDLSWQLCQHNVDFAGLLFENDDTNINTDNL